MVRNIDIAFTHGINSLAGSAPGFDMLMVVLAVYGVPALIVGTALLWWNFTNRVETRHACIASAISFCLSLLFNQALLLFIHRIRPYDAGVTHLLLSANPDWSFPSDHATAASAVVATFWFRRIRWPLYGGIPLAFLICVSRVYVGVHYVSDVVGGMVIATMVSWLVARFYPSKAWPLRRLVALL